MNGIHSEAVNKIQDLRPMAITEFAKYMQRIQRFLVNFRMWNPNCER